MAIEQVEITKTCQYGQRVQPPWGSAYTATVRHDAGDVVEITGWEAAKDFAQHVRRHGGQCRILAS